MRSTTAHRYLTQSATLPTNQPSSSDEQEPGLEVGSSDLAAYIEGTGFAADLSGPLFRTIRRGTGQLSASLFTISGSMPKIDWLTGSEDENVSAHVPHRLLEAVPSQRTCRTCSSKGTTWIR